MSRQSTVDSRQADVYQYGPASNGQRFLVNMRTSDGEPTVNMITNWERALTTSAVP